MAHGRRRRPRVPARRLDRPRAQRVLASPRSKTSTACSARSTACCGPRAVRVLARAPDGAVHRRRRAPSSARTSTRRRSTSPRRRAIRVSPLTIADVFSALHRAGYRVDVLLEPRPDTARRPVPPPSCGAPAKKAPEPVGCSSAVDAPLTRPRRRALVRLVLVDLALFEPDLQQEVERLADDPARADAEDLHHLVAVERGRIARAPPARAARRCALRARPSAARARRPFWLRVVQSHGELVEVVEQRARVAHVAADGAVGPAHRVRVEAQVQLDELWRRRRRRRSGSAAPAAGRQPPQDGGHSRETGYGHGRLGGSLRPHKGPGAGLDIGAISPEEIALSIMAEVTSLRRQKIRVKQRGETGYFMKMSGSAGHSGPAEDRMAWAE